MGSTTTLQLCIHLCNAHRCTDIFRLGSATWLRAGSSISLPRGACAPSHTPKACTGCLHVCMRRCIHTFQMGPRPGAPQLPRSQEPPLRRPCSAALDPGFQLPARGGSRCRCRPRGRAALGRGGGGCPGTRHGPTASRLAPLPPRRCSRGLTWMVCLLYTFTT